MRASKRASALSVVVLAGILCGPINLCRAQVVVVGGGNQSETLVPLSSVPGSGIFWSAGGNLPPSPFDPLPQLQLYVYGPASNQVYVYDDRNFDYSAYWAGNVSATNGGVVAMDDNGPPPPPGGGGTNGGGSGGGPHFPYPSFTTNDLWLQIITVTNHTAALVIHPPWNVTNGVYDLFFTTNLEPPASWQWVMRTAPGQTNLAPTNATGADGFYKIELITPSAGTDFWVAFAACWGDDNLRLYVSSQVTSSGTVSSAELGFTNSFSLTPGTVTNIALPDDAMITSYDTVTAKGIHITASQPVSVYGLNYYNTASAAFTGYPTPMLGTNYCVMARPSDASGVSLFAILGTASNTTVTIMPSATANLATNSGSPGKFYTERLQPAETYQIDSRGTTDDVTGTLITSDKPIAVFAGADLAYVPVPTNESGNPLDQELLPVSAWGDQALALSFGRLSGDSYRVLAANNNTEVTTNGVMATNLQAGQFYDAIVDGPVEFQGSNPIQVAQFAQGGGIYANNYGYGDPCEILLPPTGHYLTSYTVAIPAGDGITGDFTNNFLNLIVATNATLTKLDGTNIHLLTTNFFAIGSSGYSASAIMGDKWRAYGQQFPAR